MRDRLFIFAFFALAALLLPPALRGAAEGTRVPPGLPETFEILLTETGEVRTVTPEEYLVGCLAAEIPIDYEQEALNAQAAASYTYALRLAANPENTPEGALLSDDGKTHQPFFTPEKCAELYGESYAAYLPRLKEAAAYGVSHPITYEGEPIYAVYHSVSAGRTSSAYGIWGRELAYLAPAESAADRDYPYYECTNEMTVEAARLALVAAKSDIVTPADYGKWFSDFNINEDGYVLSVRIGENLFSGGDIWRIFGLRSTAFTVEYRDGIFTFRTKGYGHGAGLSQYGANELAKAGKTAEEILTHYYTGVTVG
ncbi:MAG: SpoIID/LytB domain-containing protein [Bacteroides sp.]|nr:SpoIID/LytB domain-containing protein [Eubacterium sp.]MCM1417593.1 SpoIID/LytB domain-containing protein [Roseburia sp.]MCM1461696.1 SpoIID/LytB domain-containing protein [Bacteroides sp.]